MSSRRLTDCSVAMTACLAEFEAQLHGAQINFVRACTYRNGLEQLLLYEQGRSKPGPIVTWLKPGKSRHNDTYNGVPSANAADYYPLLNGKLAGDHTKSELALWEKMGQIGEACGLEWGGRWRNGKTDRPHFQLKKQEASCKK